MTLHNANRNNIESAQANAVQNAGGAGLRGYFEWTINGWEVTFKYLTFDEIVRVADAVKQVLEL